MFTKQELPGIGASLGLDRLLAAMEELGMLAKVTTPAQVLIAYFSQNQLHTYLRLAAQLRGTGLGVELYPEPKRLGQQLKYADLRGFRVALIAGDDELARGTCQVKDLRTGEGREVCLDPLAQGVAQAVRAILDADPT
jgi:histidyl-tRNA synthetase